MRSFAVTFFFFLALAVVNLAASADRANRSAHSDLDQQSAHVFHGR